MGKAAAASSPLTLAGIRETHERIKAHIHRTPVLSCSSLANHRNKFATLHLKCENLQKIGAFKIRGALNAVGSLDAQTQVVTTHSSGNHAQAIALACKTLGKKAVIVMPKDSPKVKVNAVRDSYGAEVRFCEPNQPAREAMCNAVLAEYSGGPSGGGQGAGAESESSAAMIHPYDDSRVVHGQATVAVEFLEDVRALGGHKLDAIVVAVGGGGLLSGCAFAAKQMDPSIKVIAAEPAEANDCWRSYQKGWPEQKELNNGPPKTIADSVKTNMGDFTYPVIAKHVDHVIQVTESEIREGMRLTMERAKLVLEPGAAVAVAAACVSREIREKFPDVEHVGVVLCGGNLDLEGIPGLI